jgi:NAD(P)H-flavin reductase
LSRYFKAEIQENRPVHAVHNLLTLNVPVSMPEPRPGQFFMIEVNKGTDPLLKRAFSLFRKTENGLQILYRVRGKGTEILKEMKEGSVIEVLGPLGTCYPLPTGDVVPLVIAGGIGIASVFSFVEQLAGRAIVFYGARTKNDLLMHDELKGFAKEILVSTDDGSAGQKGTIEILYLLFCPFPNPQCPITACMPAVHTCCSRQSRRSLRSIRYRHTSPWKSIWPVVSAHALGVLSRPATGTHGSARKARCLRPRS